MKCQRRAIWTHIAYHMMLISLSGGGAPMHIIADVTHSPAVTVAGSPSAQVACAAHRRLRPS